MDAKRLEIVLVAIGILLLVSVFGIVILVCVGLQPARRRRSLEDSHKTAAWGGSWIQDDRADDEPYRDETFLDSVRRRSVSLTENIQQDLLLVRDQTLTAISAGRTSSSPSRGLARTLRKLSSAMTAELLGGDKIVASPRRVSEPVAQLFNHTI